jgi:hypothetical protein
MDRELDPDRATSPRTVGGPLVFLVTGLVGGLVLAVVGWVVGATYGGNHATDFAFNGLRGYEATGRLGAMFGFVAGFALCAGLVGLLTSRRRGARPQVDSRGC